MTRHLHSVATTLFAATLLFFVGFVGQAQAASYGNFVDPAGTAFYNNVADVNGLYGAPSVSLNSLDFTPTAFQALCGSGCAGDATTTDTLTMDIIATDGWQISEINISEGLDYQLQAFGTGAFSSVTVVANVFVDVFEVDGISINGLSQGFAVAFDPSNSYTVSGPTGIDGGIFTGALSIDILSILQANAVIGNATGVRISFDNTLQAFHAGGGQALIRKRDTDFVSLTMVAIPVVVPEPTTAFLLLGGLAMLSARRRASA